MQPTILLFDVSGTLCDTRAVDEECLLQACSHVLSCDVGGSDWTAAPQISATGIVQWLWLHHRDRLPHPEEEQAVTKKFYDLMQAAITNSPNRCQAIPGAVTLLRHLPQCWYVAAATGGWQEPAQLKLRTAGLPVEILAASSTDSPDRMEIFQVAAKRVASTSGDDRPVVLVGDGEWDVRVAQALGWRFVGIGEGAQAERLHRAGAEHVICDFVDQLAFEAMVRASRVPIHAGMTADFTKSAV